MKDFLKEALRFGVKIQLDPKDSMYHGVDAQYFEVGASALSAVKASLDVLGLRANDIKSVLDYACGYGRVSRWLRAAFPKAIMLGVDADQKAVRSINETLNIPSQLADITLRSDLGSKFDLIWMGSLTTHLPKDESRKVLSYLQNHLAPKGVLVATMHGPYVADRIRCGEKLYGLEMDQVSCLLSSYDESGYGFGLYPKQHGYGISAATPKQMHKISEESGLNTVAYWEKRWANHQDVYVLTRE